MQISEEINNSLALQINLALIFNVLQRLVMTHDDVILFSETVSDTELVTILIPAECAQGQTLWLSFPLPDAVSSKSLEENDNARNLTFGIAAFSLQNPDENIETGGS